jgi:hypothetical protein
MLSHTRGSSGSADKEVSSYSTHQVSLLLALQPVTQVLGTLLDGVSSITAGGRQYSRQYSRQGSTAGSTAGRTAGDSQQVANDSLE